MYNGMSVSLVLPCYNEEAGLKAMLDALSGRGLDFITVRRMHLDWERTADLIIKFFGKKALDFTASALLLKMIYDSQSGMWVFPREILSRMSLVSDGMSFSEEIKMEAFSRRDIRAAELPVLYQYRKRAGGPPKLKMIRDGAHNLYFLFEKRLRLLKNV